VQTDRIAKQLNSFAHFDFAASVKIKIALKVLYPEAERGLVKGGD